jgi:hypothetical protein
MTPLGLALEIGAWNLELTLQAELIFVSLPHFPYNPKVIKI